MRFSKRAEQLSDKSRHIHIYLERLAHANPRSNESRHNFTDGQLSRLDGQLPGS
jgi:hypothetical protein